MLLKREALRGAGYGVLATLVMTLVMLTGMGTGMAPMPEPIPRALAGLFLGIFVDAPSAGILMATGMVAHFAYGAAAGVLFVLLFAEWKNVRGGLLWGAILWFIMQVLVLPLIGWGAFGLSVTGFPPKIAVGTLVLHLIYGGILGWGVGRSADPPA